MRPDLHGIDPWAGRSPRRRDWIAAALGALLLAAGGILSWQSTDQAVAVASHDSIDAAAWQAAADRSQRLNGVLDDLSRPWSRWLERSLALAGDDVQLERLEGQAADQRLEMVIGTADLGRASSFVDALASVPGIAGARITRHEATAEGVRVHAEVSLR